MDDDIVEEDLSCFLLNRLVALSQQHFNGDQNTRQQLNGKYYKADSQNKVAEHQPEDTAECF